MPFDEPIAFGLAGLVVAAFLAGLAASRWRTDPIEKLRNEILLAISTSRSAGDAKTDELEEKIDAYQREQANRIELLAEKQHKFELDVSNNYLRKASAAESFSRLEKLIDRGNSDTKAQLGRLQDLIVPSPRMQAQLGRLETAKHDTQDQD